MYPETEIAGKAKRAAQRERLATAGAAVPAAAAETPARPVALPPSTVPDTGIPSWVQPTAHRLLVGDVDQREALRESGQVGLVCFPSQNLVLSDSERLAREQLFHGLPVHVGFDPYYRAGVELEKLRTVGTTAVSVFQQPVTSALSDAMETGASGISSVSLMELPTGVEGDTMRPTSAMQVSSSDHVFPAPAGNDGIGVVERPSPLPPVSWTPGSAVSSSSDDASAAGARKNSATPVNPPVIDPPAQ